MAKNSDAAKKVYAIARGQQLAQRYTRYVGIGKRALAKVAMVDFADNVAVCLLSVIYTPGPFALAFFIHYVVGLEHVTEQVSAADENA